MRLLLTLRSNKGVDQRQAFEKYFTAMHGFAYNKLSSSNSFKRLHETDGFKGFCFGNLFPVKNNRLIENKEYSVVITSPLPKIIETLFFQIKEEEMLNVGEFSFTVMRVQLQRFKIKPSDVLETMTLINVTKHDNGKIRALKFKDKGYLEHLRKNLVHKYNQFNEVKVLDNFDLFKNIEIKLRKGRNELSIPIFFYNKEKNKRFNIIGNKLVFHINDVSEEQLKVLQFCFDAGFGERNSYGMGFMVVRNRKND